MGKAQGLLYVGFEAAGLGPSLIVARQLQNHVGDDSLQTRSHLGSGSCFSGPWHLHPSGRAYGLLYVGFGVAGLGPSLIVARQL